jgi:hypothetical protein
MSLASAAQAVVSLKPPWHGQRCAGTESASSKLDAAPLLQVARFIDDDPDEFWNEWLFGFPGRDPKQSQM